MLQDTVQCLRQSILFMSTSLYHSSIIFLHIFLSTWSHKNTYLSALSVWQFYVPHSTFRRSFKEKCPLSGAKTQVKYANPDKFWLHKYMYILLCFYFVATETYCGSLEFKYTGSVAYLKVNALSCPTPNPTLNLHDSVNKCKTDIKTFNATVPFKLPYVEIWTALWNRDYTGFKPELLTS